MQANSLTEGYGYQWWVTTAGGHNATQPSATVANSSEVVPDLRLVAVFSTDTTEINAAVDTPYTRILSQIIDQVENA